MQEWEKAWLACAIDGEGSIFMMKRTDSTTIKRHKRGFTWRIKIQVCNTVRPFCEMAKKIANRGQIYVQKRLQVSERHKKVSYFWNIDSSMAAEILEPLLPYFVIKKQLAELVIEARRLIKEHIYTSHNDARLEEIYIKMKQLNRRGNEEVVPNG